MIKIWAIDRDHLERFDIFRELEKTARENFSLEAIQSIKAEAVENAGGIPIYERKENAAHINISGTLENNRTISTSLYGQGTVYKEIQEGILKANEDYLVEEIFLHINSPGGTWDGMDYTYQVVADSKKPITALVYTEALSGGYYLAAAADRIYAVTNGSAIGSIGVAAEVWDRTVENDKKGIKRVLITNDESPKKRPDITTDAGKDIIREQVNMAYGIFKDRVIEGRSKYQEFKAENIDQLKGGVIMAEKALELGLIDGILQTKEKNLLSAGGNIILEGKEVKLEELLTKNPEAKAEHETALATAKTAGIEEGKKAASEAALNAERERGADILALAGVEKGVIDAYKSGQDSGAYAKALVLKQNKARADAGQGGITALGKGAQIPADGAPADEGGDGLSAEAKANDAIMAAGKPKKEGK